MVKVVLALIGVYLEESGVPMPVPSEVSIGYLGHYLAGNPVALFLTWLGLTLLIVAGSTNLFAASRRYGPRLLNGRVGAALHLTPARIGRAQRWFHRWGTFAIVLARYVPGLRWAMAVTCGTLGVSYRTYWLSSAASAALWTGFLLTIGLSAGDTVAQVLEGHPWIVLLLPVPAATVIGVSVLRLLSPTPALPPERGRVLPNVRHISSSGGA